MGVREGAFGVRPREAISSVASYVDKSEQVGYQCWSLIYYRLVIRLVSMVYYLMVILVIDGIHVRSLKQMGWLSVLVSNIL